MRTVISCTFQKAGPVSQLSWAKKKRAPANYFPSKGAIPPRSEAPEELLHWHDWNYSRKNTHKPRAITKQKVFFFFFACTKARRKCSHCDTWFQVPQFHLEHKNHTKISRETMPGMRVPSKGGCAGLGNLLVTKKKKQSGEIFPTTLVHQNLLVTKQSRKIFPTTTLHQRNPQIASGGKKKVTWNLFNHASQPKKSSTCTPAKSF